MKNATFRRLTALVLCGAAAVALLTGCAKREPARRTLLAMDTVMNLTLCKDGKGIKAEQALDRLGAELTRLDGELSVTDPNSPMYDLNRANGDWIQLTPDGSELLGQALSLCDLTDGALDITAYPAVASWGFPTGDYQVLTEEECARLQSWIDYSAVEWMEDSAQARMPVDMAVDLGGVAKGYAGDKLAALLDELGIDSALLDLGQSTIQAIGTKPDGTPWRVGVQDPKGESYLGVLELADCGMGTSGSYQRFFERDGVTYCHIIAPPTAAPARSGLESVTVVARSGLLCDGLSTALFVMGLEEATAFWRSHPELEFEALFLTEDGGIYLTPGLADAFSLAEGYESREVTVLS